MSPILSELIASLSEGEKLCLLPIARLHVEEPRQLSQEIAIFPPEAINPAVLRVVEWPERHFGATIGQMRHEDGEIAAMSVKRPFNCGYLSSLHIDPNRGHGPFRGHAS